MRHIVNGLLIRDGSVLMAYRAKNRNQYPDCWSFPGGHVEPGETLEQALLRELTEEIGITALAHSKFDEITVRAANGSDRIRFHLFVVHRWSGTPHLVNHEHTQLQWTRLSEATELRPLALPHYDNLLRALADAYPAPPVNRPQI